MIAHDIFHYHYSIEMLKIYIHDFKALYQVDTPSRLGWYHHQFQRDQSGHWPLRGQAKSCHTGDGFHVARTGCRMVFGMGQQQQHNRVDEHPSFHSFWFCWGFWTQGAWDAMGAWAKWEGAKDFVAPELALLKATLGMLENLLLLYFSIFLNIHLLMWRALGYVDAGWRLGTDLLTLLGLLGESRDPLIKGMTLLSKEWIGSFLVLVHHFWDLFVRWRHNRSWSEVKFCIFGLRC